MFFNFLPELNHSKPISPPPSPLCPMQCNATVSVRTLTGVIDRDAYASKNCHCLNQLPKTNVGNMDWNIIKMQQQSVAMSVSVCFCCLMQLAQTDKDGQSCCTARGTRHTLHQRETLDITISNKCDHASKKDIRITGGCDSHMIQKIQFP